MTDSLPNPAPPTRCISLDVEDYFHIEAAHRFVPKDAWAEQASRVEMNMDHLLDMFDELDAKATMFILGDVAKRHPQLARKCADAGHEIASHGTLHDRLHRLTPASMLEDVRASKQLLEDQTGCQVRGYRAPTWSVTRQTAWAVDVLREAGFDYDASVFPVHHPQYGVPDAPDRPYHLRSDQQDGGTLLEVPPLTWRVGTKRLAVAGGGYFRLLPLALMERGLRQAAAEQRPAILYFHPWEFDPQTPRMPLNFTGRVRTYTGLSRSTAKLRHILTRYDTPQGWRPIADHLDAFEAAAKRRDGFTLQSAG